LEQYWFVYSDDEDELESEPESDEPIDIHIINNQILDSKDFIDVYIINRNHIREQSKSVIPACGFLLTGAFGLLYFIYSGNNDRIPTNPLIIVSLLFSSLFLAASIITSIKSVQAASSSQELPETRDQQWDFIFDIYNEEYKWGRYSIWLLGLALLLFVFIILYFSVMYLVGAPSNDNVPTYIVIPLPRLF
jgi:hypothetical protein